METVTLDLLYNELKSIKKKISIVEHAIIPTIKLSPKELAEHQKDLKQALEEKKASFRDI